jgi:hypothetical protein
MNRLLTVLVTAVLALPSETVYRIGVAKINGVPLTSDKASDIASPVILEGWVDHGAGKMQDLAVRIAVRQPDQQEWQLLPDPAESLTWSQKSWRLSPLHLDGAWPREFRAVLLEAPHRLPPGPFDEVMLRRIALAISEPVIVQVSRPPEAVPDNGPRVQFDKLGSYDVKPGATFQVGQQETVECRYRKPLGATVQAVVIPIEGDSHWAMLGGTGVRSVWTGNAVFGRDGLDAFKEFLVFCVVADPPLPRREIDPSEWTGFEKDRILAKSNYAHAVRFDPPEDPKRQVGIETTHVHTRRVDPDREWRVPPLSAIGGTATGRGISVGERIWLFKAPRGDTDAWTMVGEGSVKNERSWEFAPAHLRSALGPSCSLVAREARRAMGFAHYRAV